MDLVTLLVYWYLGGKNITYDTLSRGTKPYPNFHHTGSLRKQHSQGLLPVFADERRLKLAIEHLQLLQRVILASGSVRQYVVAAHLCSHIEQSTEISSRRMRVEASKLPSHTIPQNPDAEPFQ